MPDPGTVTAMRGCSTMMAGGAAAVFACCLADARHASAQGGPPLITDDPGTPGDGQWEINLAYLEDRTAEARSRGVPHVDLNYGLGDHIQLKYETGYLLVNDAGSNGTKRDLDDSLLGVKWRFLDQEQAGVDVSIYPQLEVANSQRSVRRRVAEPDPNLLLPRAQQLGGGRDRRP